MKNFININTTEEEQVERIKQWLKANVIPLVVGITIGLGGIFGWNYYADYKVQQNIVARANYLSVEKDINTEINLDNHSSYQQQAQMLKVKNAVTTNKYDSAITTLENIKSDNILQDVINIRLARIYLQQSKFEEAVVLLKANKLNSVSKHLLGDAYTAMGKIELAKETYTLADSLTTNQQLKSLIQMKINDLK